jgi:putative ABC transport system permease protein
VADSGACARFARIRLARPLFSLTSTALTAVAFGLVPAWRSSRTSPSDACKQTTSLVRTGWGRFRLHDLLVVTQVSLAVMLLIGAGLMIRSLHRLTQIDPGFKPAHLLTLKPAPPPMDEFRQDPLAVGRYYQDILDRVQALPGVDSAAFASSLPFTGANSWMNIFRLDRPVPAPGEFFAASTHTVTPDYFRTMGIPLLRGRLLTGLERSPAPGAVVTPEDIATIFKDLVLDAVVSQRMADRFWPGEDPIGKRFQLGFPEMSFPAVEVVGIVGNTTQSGLDRGEPPEFYLSNRQFPTPMGMHLVVRPATKADNGGGAFIDPSLLMPVLRAAVQEVVTDRPILDIKLMTTRIDESIAGRRFNMGLFTFFASAALLLATLGIHGVLAFVVGRRTREFGIRMALGAPRLWVLGDVLRRGLTLVLIGAGVGLAGAWALSRLLQSQLFGITRTDPATYLCGVLVLLLSALLASLLPARRATRIDPVDALRSE